MLFLLKCLHKLDAIMCSIVLHNIHVRDMDGSWRDLSCHLF